MPLASKEKMKTYIQGLARLQAHTIIISRYALDTKLDLPVGAKNAVFKAMDKHILASSGLIGLFKK